MDNAMGDKTLCQDSLVLTPKMQILLPHCNVF